VEKPGGSGRSLLSKAFIKPCATVWKSDKLYDCLAILRAHSSYTASCYSSQMRVCGTRLPNAGWYTVPDRGILLVRLEASAPALTQRDLISYR
jgi:hypothetical protein